MEATMTKAMRRSRGNIALHIEYHLVLTRAFLGLEN
jgi:hypothetical protein